MHQRLGPPCDGVVESTLRDDLVEDGPKCLRCGTFSWKAAEVRGTHRASEQSVRLCNGCHRPEELARLGHTVMWYQRNAKDTVLALRANPELIVGQACDSSAYHDKTEADSYREWADTFAWRVPALAAELYKQWKEPQHPAEDQGPGAVQGRARRAHAGANEETVNATFSGHHRRYPPRTVVPHPLGLPALVAWLKRPSGTRSAPVRSISSQIHGK